MYNFKKVLAMVLALVLTLSVAVCAFAEVKDPNKLVYSPTKGDTTTYSWNSNYGGITVESHKSGDTIAYKWTDKYGNSKRTVSDVAATKPGTVIAVASMSTGRKYEETEEYWRTLDEPNSNEIEKIGTGSYGIGAGDQGQNVTGLNVKSKAPLVTVSTKALADSKIANVVIDADNVLIEKNATKGTKAKTVAFAFPKATKANQLTIKKGAFNGAKKVRIVVSPKMTTKELKKLKKKLKKNLGATAYKKIKIVRGQA